MKDYKRLTGKPVNGDKGYMFNCDNCPRKGASFCGTYDCSDMVCDRLGELEDKIEQGRLVEPGEYYIKQITQDTYIVWQPKITLLSDFLPKEEAETKLQELRGGE